MSVVELGYHLSSEEHPPRDLVRYAQHAASVGFTFALISDHYHPWLDVQGNSPYAWSTLGAIAQAVPSLRLGTGVTCPTFRYHPAIIAQAAATLSLLTGGRFFLGVGTGEAINEHIVGELWPPIGVRREMLAEAVGVIRQLWRGGWVEHRGTYFTVDKARLFSLPETPPPLYVAASGRHTAELAGRCGDGLISVVPTDALPQRFAAAGGSGKPRYGKLTICWAKTEAAARRTAYTQWRSPATTGALNTMLPQPYFFDQAAKLSSEDDVARHILTDPDPAAHIARIKRYVAAGYDHVYVHQIGPDQEGFFRFYEREVLPEFT